MNKTFKDFVSEAKRRVREVTVEEARAELASDAPPVLLDVREDSEWALGRAAGAVHLGRGVLERDAHSVLPDPGARVVCYCGGGARSALAADTLQEMGYTNVASMIGGFAAWTKEGGEVER